MTCNSVTITYPGQAIEEPRLKIYLDYEKVLPVGDTNVTVYYPTNSATKYWFNISHVTNGSATTLYDNVTVTNYEDTITYDGASTASVHKVSTAREYGTFPSPPIYRSVDNYISINSSSGDGIALKKDDRCAVSVTVGDYTRYLTIGTDISFGYSEDTDVHKYAGGSLKYHVNTNMAAMIDGEDGSETNLLIFSVQDHDNTNYVRNAQCWIYGKLDLTCCSPWNSTGDPSKTSLYGIPSGQFRPATAITSKHVISANHYHMLQTWGNSNRDFKLRFVTQDNQVIERTAVAAKQIIGIDEDIAETYFSPNYVEYNDISSATIDYVVIQLDSELPSSIKPAKRLPNGWARYMPPTRGLSNYALNLWWNENFPAVMTDMQERATISESLTYACGTFNTANDSIDGWDTDYFEPVFSRVGPCFFENRTTYLPFYRQKIDGDSSSPAIMFVNNEPVLLCALRYGGGGGNLPITIFADRVQDIITNDFGDTNIWETVDLSGFTKY